MNKLFEGFYNVQIETAVKKYLKKDFKVNDIKKTNDSAMHDNAIFTDGYFRIFVKAGSNPFSLEQFNLEVWGLNHIRTNSQISTPTVIDVLDVDGTALLLMKSIDVKPVESKSDWEILGRGLATLHMTKRDKCGLETNSYLGIFKQDNTPCDTWEEFFGEKRLRDSMKMAVDAGNMIPAQCQPIERLITKLHENCSHNQSFSLLHGDPWPGNLLFDGKQMIAIDCSIYYGNREIDLSTVDFFYPVPEHFFEGYNEVYPIEKGYAERKSLWQINQWLGHVTLFGEEYMPKLMEAVNKYL